MLLIPSVQRESSIRHIQEKSVPESVFLLFDLVVEVFNFFLMNEEGTQKEPLFFQNNWVDACTDTVPLTVASVFFLVAPHPSLHTPVPLCTLPATLRAAGSVHPIGLHLQAKPVGTQNATQEGRAPQGHKEHATVGPPERGRGCFSLEEMKQAAARAGHD